MAAVQVQCKRSLATAAERNSHAPFDSYPTPGKCALLSAPVYRPIERHHFARRLKMHMSGIIEEPGGTGPESGVCAAGNAMSGRRSTLRSSWPAVSDGAAGRDRARFFYGETPGRIESCPGRGFHAAVS